MDLGQAKKSVWWYIIISIIIGVPSFIMIIFGLLKFLYIDFYTPISNNPSSHINKLYYPILNLIELIFKKTNSLYFFQKYSPTPILSPNIGNMNTAGNYWFLFYVFLLVISVLLWNSSASLRKRIKKTKKKSEEKKWGSQMDKD
ncbi:MAG: YniB family protein [bacterium]